MWRGAREVGGGCCISVKRGEGGKGGERGGLL